MKDRRFTVALTVLLVALAACSESTTESKRAARSAPSVPATGERLLAQPPDGWTEVFATDRAGIKIAEYVPPDSPEEWVEKVTFEALTGVQLPDPIEFLTDLAADQKANCDGFQDHNTFSGYENNYPTSVRLFACTNNPLFKKGQVTLLKVITGDESFYTISWSLRTEPWVEGQMPGVEAEIGIWAKYLSAIGVCNPDASDHLCPNPESP